MEELSLSFGLGKDKGRVLYLKSQEEVKVEQSECPFSILIGQMIVESGTGKHCIDPIL